MHGGAMSLYVYLAAAIAVATASAAGTWQVQDWRYGAKERERLEAVERDRRRAEKTVDLAAAGHEADKTRIRTEFITITKEVERVTQAPFYAAADAPACLDDAGLRELAAALGNTPAAGVAPAAVPGPRAAD
jgi:Ribonuclease G/E